MTVSLGESCTNLLNTYELERIVEKELIIFKLFFTFFRNSVLYNQAKYRNKKVIVIYV